MSSALEGILAQGKISQSQFTELYKKYITDNTELTVLREANNVIDQELKKVMELLVASAKGADKFGENLNDFTGNLTKASSLDVLRASVEKIAAETRAVAAENDKLHVELANTTTQLSAMSDNLDRIHKESQIDPLTEVGNRKFFESESIRALEEAQSDDSALSVLMVDIDHFKKFNDTHGHLIGDQVLRLVAHTLVENLKGRDIIARYGGEEFIILLPQTRLQDAERVANLLRTSLASKRIKKRGSNEILGVITISLGAAQYRRGEDRETLIARADEAMYKAKQTGRNKVMCEDEDNA
jgi:diguanylate cyclase